MENNINYQMPTLTLTSKKEGCLGWRKHCRETFNIFKYRSLKLMRIKPKIKACSNNISAGLSNTAGKRPKWLRWEITALFRTSNRLELSPLSVNKHQHHHHTSVPLDFQLHWPLWWCYHRGYHSCMSSGEFLKVFLKNLKNPINFKHLQSRLNLKHLPPKEKHHNNLLPTL